MKNYIEQSNGSYTIDNMSIPHSESNRHYNQMLAEVEAGEAEILPYVEPAKTQEQINAEHRAYLDSTDWYITRKMETGEEIPQGVLDARQAAREGVIE